MKQKNNRLWTQAVLIRAVKTFIQAGFSVLTIEVLTHLFSWPLILVTALLSFTYSLLTNIFVDLPESSTDGELVIDKSDPNKNSYLLNLAIPFEDLDHKKVVSFDIQHAIHEQPDNSQ